MPQKAKENVSYEAMIARLEEIAADLERGSLSLSEAMKVYKEALVLSEKCAKLLDSFRGTVTQVQEGKEVSLHGEE